MNEVSNEKNPRLSTLEETRYNILGNKFKSFSFNFLSFEQELFMKKWIPCVGVPCMLA